MKKIIDGIEIIDGEKMLAYKPNLLPVIKGLADVLGDEVMNQYLHECLGEEANFYPSYFDIGLGTSKGWAELTEQMDLIIHITNKLFIKTGRNHFGKYHYIVCE